MHTIKNGMHLRDDQWQKLEPLLIGRANDPGAHGKNNRLFFEAILWIVLNNRPWAELPAHFNNWNAAYMRFRRWNQSDLWRELMCLEIDDDELQWMLTQIVNYGDLYTQRAVRRQARKTNRANYSFKLWATQPEVAPENSSNSVGECFVSQSRPEGRIREQKHD